MAPSIGIGLSPQKGGFVPFKPSNIDDLAFFFDMRDAFDEGGGTINVPDITGTWTLEPTVDDGSISITTDSNGIDRVTIAGRSDSLQVSLTGSAQVPLAAELTFGAGFAFRNNNADGLMELGVSGAGWSYLMRNNGDTGERSRTYDSTVAQSTRDCITDSLAASQTPHHKIIRATSATIYEHRNAWDESGTSGNGSPTGTATVLTVGGSVNGPATTFGDGHYYFIYAYKRDILGDGDMPFIDDWVKSDFHVLGLNKTDP